VLLRKKYLILRHGHKKTRQEKGEEEEQKVTFALLPLFVLTNTGPQGRCFSLGITVALKTCIGRGWSDVASAVLRALKASESRAAPLRLSLCNAGINRPE
jgi:hypothetical protein